MRILWWIAWKKSFRLQARRLERSFYASCFTCYRFREDRAYSIPGQRAVGHQHQREIWAGFQSIAGRVIAEVPFCTAEEVDRVVRSAAGALEAWAETPVVERVRVLFKFREICLERFDECANLVTREHGKTLVEAKASVHAGIEVVEFACGIPSLIMGATLANIARNVDSETIAASGGGLRGDHAV